MMGREKYSNGKKKLMNHDEDGGGSVMEWTCMAASGTSLMFNDDDVTAHRSSRINSV